MMFVSENCYKFIVYILIKLSKIQLKIKMDLSLFIQQYNIYIYIITI